MSRRIKQQPGYEADPVAKYVEGQRHGYVVSRSQRRGFDGLPALGRSRMCFDHEIASKYIQIDVHDRAKVPNSGSAVDSVVPSEQSSNKGKYGQVACLRHQ